MPAKLAEADQMTIGEFLAFTRSRRDGGIWELVEGVAVMSPPPTEWHQTICTNAVYRPMGGKLALGASWQPMPPGAGTRVPNCQNYVTVATKTAEVIRHDRASGWVGPSMKGLRDTLALPALDVAIPLRDVYRFTPIERASSARQPRPGRAP
jgi:hypothetical protein